MKVTILDNWNIRFEAETDEDECSLRAVLSDDELLALFNNNLLNQITEFADTEADAQIQGRGGMQPTGLIACKPLKRQP